MPKEQRKYNQKVLVKQETLYNSLKTQDEVQCLPGCEVYYTNDTTGDYFPETYFLDSYDEQLYFETIEEAAECVSEIVGCTVEATVNAIQEALEKYVEQKENEGEEVFYSLHEFQVIDD